MIVAAADICWTVTKCQIQTSKCFNPHQKKTYEAYYYYYPHFIDMETEAQRGLGTYTR